MSQKIYKIKQDITTASFCDLFQLYSMDQGHPEKMSPPIEAEFSGMVSYGVL
jgi:hypothetical protein